MSMIWASSEDAAMIPVKLENVQNFTVGQLRHHRCTRSCLLVWTAMLTLLVSNRGIAQAPFTDSKGSVTESPQKKASPTENTRNEKNPTEIQAKVARSNAAIAAALNKIRKYKLAVCARFEQAADGNVTFCQVQTVPLQIPGWQRLRWSGNLRDRGK
ncbi:MAG: hypothetical protein JWM11_7438 [Planctomycetaceae bacterium]|nr:hypothetical protein [Planctomycetaceae bacterium]